MKGLQPLHALQRPQHDALSRPVASVRLGRTRTSCAGRSTCGTKGLVAACSRVSFRDDTRDVAGWTGQTLYLSKPRSSIPKYRCAAGLLGADHRRTVRVRCAGSARAAVDATPPRLDLATPRRECYPRGTRGRFGSVGWAGLPILRIVPFSGDGEPPVRLPGARSLGRKYVHSTMCWTSLLLAYRQRRSS